MKRQRASTLRGGSRDSPPEASALALQPVYQPAVPVPPPPAPPPPSRKAAKKPKASAAAAAAAQQHTQPIVASQQPLQGQEDISLEERIQQNQEQLRAVERQASAEFCRAAEIGKGHSQTNHVHDCQNFPK